MISDSKSVYVLWKPGCARGKGVMHEFLELNSGNIEVVCYHEDFDFDLIKKEVALFEKECQRKQNKLKQD